MKSNNPNTRTYIIGGLLAVAATIGLGFVTMNRLKNEKRPALVQPPERGDPTKGKLALGKYGCAACHFIPGIKGRQNLPGPPLTSLAYRSHIAAGMLENSTDNMIKWVMHPTSINPRTTMPNVGVTQNDAEDIAAYLYKSN